MQFKAGELVLVHRLQFLIQISVLTAIDDLCVCVCAYRGWSCTASGWAGWRRERPSSAASLREAERSSSWTDGKHGENENQQRVRSERRRGCSSPQKASKGLDSAAGDTEERERGLWVCVCTCEDRNVETVIKLSFTEQHTFIHCWMFTSL